MRLGHFSSPMRFSFKHASAERKETQNVIIALQDADGHVGYGEGCPRHYVTGETSDSARSFLRQHGTDAAKSCLSLAALTDWIDTHQYLIDANPAAFCAFELAALDLLGKREGCNVETLLGLPGLGKPASYTAVVGDSSPLKMHAICLAYTLVGFSDFKVKLGGDLGRENKRLAALPRAATVRFDANNLWQNAENCISYCQKLERRFWAIEEPVRAFDAEALTTIATTLDTRVILDESCIRIQDLDPYLDNPKLFIANVRVSKCGGILRSIRLANFCLSNGIDVILGAHVGETSLLTRAALVVSQGMSKPPLAREGAYGRLLLKCDIAENPIQFGRNGILRPERTGLRGKNGLGLDVIPGQIDWLHNG